MENGLGEVIGIEVKASATPRGDDFRGPRHLADRLGNDFIAGYLMYASEKTLPFAKNMLAVPISALWEVGEVGTGDNRRF